MNITKRFLSILLVAAFSLSAWALDQDTEGYYLIGTAQDWQVFAELVKTTPTANAKLTADIAVSTMIGSESKKYSGVFDGGYHTITANITGTSNYVAPFCYLKGATIKNIKAEGTVSGGTHCAGLVGAIDDSGLISNVAVSVTVSTTGSHCGGVLGHARDSYTTMEGCVFNGTINGRSGGSTVGVICGWNHGGLTTINNCVEIGSYTNCSTFNPIFCGSNISASNSYYLNPKNSGNDYGTQITASMPGEICKQMEISGNTYSVPVLVVGIDPKYNYSGEAISPDPVVSYVGTILKKGTDYTISYSHNIAVGIASVTISGKGEFEGTKVINFKITGVCLSGAGTEESPYLISSDDDWVSFVTSVEDYSFSGQYVKLTKDITITSMAGVRDDHPFSGTFDGDGHTMTANIVSTATGDGLSSNNLNDVGIAPFHFIKDATIKNVRIAGTINAKSNHAAGLIGVAYETNTISNCVVSATITTTANYVGGVIGHGYASTTTIIDCLFNGRIEGGSRIGVIWGHNHGGTGNIINCLENGTYSNGSINPIYRSEGGVINRTNNYYVTGSDDKSMKATATTLADGTVTIGLNNDRTGDDAPWIQDPVTNQPILKIFVNESGITTGDAIQVSSSKSQVTSESWYSISGLKLNGKPTAEGIYIHNGKKIVVN